MAQADAAVFDGCLVEGNGGIIEGNGRIIEGNGGIIEGNGGIIEGNGGITCWDAVRAPTTPDANAA